MPLQETSGNATTDAYGGGVAAAANYIEDVFSTYLYTGNTTAQTITNGIDLAGKGGMVWLKSRTSTAVNNLWDTARTPYYYLVSNDTVAQQSVSSSNALTAYNADGFTVTGGSNAWNGSQNYVSWTFRKQPKFFDVVTGTGQGTFNHNLGVLPGCIILKRTSTTGNWIVAHTGLTGGITGTYVCLLNTTDAQSNQSVSLSPTATTFSPTAYVGASDTWVAYFFASNAGGFGLTGTDNVISCGSFTSNASGIGTVELGYEPQWVMVKRSTAASNWRICDTMRGLPANYQDTSNELRANTSDAEVNGDKIGINATGFTTNTNANEANIYIAIRRGPMKVPTSGTTIYKPSTAASGTQISTGFNPDTWIGGATDGDAGTSSQITMDRLRGAVYLATSSTNAEIGTNNPFTTGPSNTFTNNVQGGARVEWLFGRAPNFHDVVCYTGTEVARNLTHNLTVAPELIIVKQRTSPTRNWIVGNTSIGWNKYLRLNLTNTTVTQTDIWDNTYPTSSVFTVGTNVSTNGSGLNYVAYLFATCAGISKVGTYTGNGTTQTIDCGFTGGARFVLIKQTTGSGGSWFVYDTARGMTVLTDPYLMLNNNAPNTATLGSVTTVSTGFALNSTIFADINTSAATYLFLAIA